VVSWKDPSAAPGNSAAQNGGVQVAQITVPTGSEWQVKMNIRGLSSTGDTWEVHDVTFTTHGAPVIPMPSAPEPEPEPGAADPPMWAPPHPLPPAGQCEDNCIYGRSCPGWSSWGTCVVDPTAGTAVDGPLHGGTAPDGMPSGHARVGYQVEGAACTQSRTCRRSEPQAIQKQDCGAIWQPFGAAEGQPCQSTQVLGADTTTRQPAPPAAPRAPEPEPEPASCALTTAQILSDIARVNDVCCPSRAHGCDAAPTSCSPECGALLVPLVASCGAELDTILRSGPNFDPRLIEQVQQICLRMLSSSAQTGH